MEGSKAADCYGCFDGHDTQIADADQAYVQATLKGPETWIGLPSDQVPERFKHMKRPVFRMVKALYGHPDSGTYWEEHCDNHVR